MDANGSSSSSSDPVYTDDEYVRYLTTGALGNAANNWWIVLMSVTVLFFSIAFTFIVSGQRVVSLTPVGSDKAARLLNADVYLGRPT